MADDNLKFDAELSEALTSIKQRKFVMFYVENGGNGTSAAEAAGYAAPSTAQYDCLKSKKVQEQIKRYAALCTRNSGESRETIIAREVTWATSDIRNFFYKRPLLNNDGTPSTNEAGEPLATDEMKSILDWTKEEAACVKKISWNRNGPVLELHDPMRANRNLAEYNGLTQKDDAALGADDAAALIAAAMGRMEELDHTPPASE